MFEDSAFPKQGCGCLARLCSRSWITHLHLYKGDEDDDYHRQVSTLKKRVMALLNSADINLQLTNKTHHLFPASIV
jgi:hypothetical protein